MKWWKNTHKAQGPEKTQYVSVLGSSLLLFANTGWKVMRDERKRHTAPDRHIVLAQ